jgi:hypothetical protein
MSTVYFACEERVGWVVFIPAIGRICQDHLALNFSRLLLETLKTLDIAVCFIF